jgi:hypothetical protein
VKDMKFLSNTSFARNTAIAAAGLAFLALSAPASAQANMTLMSPQATSQPAPVGNFYNWSQLGGRIQGGAQGAGEGATVGVGTITNRVAGGESVSTFKGVADLRIGSCGGCAENNVTLQGRGETTSTGFSGIRTSGPGAAHAGASSVGAGVVEMHGYGAIVRGVNPVLVPVPPVPSNNPAPSTNTGH